LKSNHPVDLAEWLNNFSLMYSESREMFKNREYLGVDAILCEAEQGIDVNEPCWRSSHVLKSHIAELLL